VLLESDTISVRDSKQLLDPLSCDPQLIISSSRSDWAEFTKQLLNGQTSVMLPSISSSVRTDGSVVVEGADGTRLHYDSAEWTAFLHGVRHGEFQP
jgi:hypothetical protein